MATILARRQIRLAVIAALESAVLVEEIESPGDWTTPPDILPAILVRSTMDSKHPISKGQPNFTTAVTVEIEARVKASTAEDAQDAIEALCYSIEMALFTNYDLIRIVNQATSVDTKTEISSEGREHFGGSFMTINFEVPETFDPFDVHPAPALSSAGIHVDLMGTYDATGTYVNPPFPDSVTPAPRTSGPDGRDEGFIDLTLS